MRIKKQEHSDIMLLELQGDLDIDSVDQFQRIIQESVSNDKKGIVLDMSHVVFIDSRGLGEILWANDYCNDNDCQLKLAGFDENCRKILEITRLKDKLEIYDECGGAVKSYA